MPMACRPRIIAKWQENSKNPPFHRNIEAWQFLSGFSFSRFETFFSYFGTVVSSIQTTFASEIENIN
jgi:hypothetical protein